MTNNSIFKKLTSFKKRKQFLIAAILSVAIYSVYSIGLQAVNGGFDSLTIGYLIALPVCFFMSKTIINSGPGGEKVKDSGAEDFYSEDEDKK